MAEEFPTTERHHPYNNDTLYGAAKTFNEGMLRSFHDMYGLDYVALRYFNVYGPRMDIHGVYTEVLVRWMERIAAGQPPLIFGDGRQTMDFVHVADIARANMLAADADVTDGVFNIAQRHRDQPRRAGRRRCRGPWTPTWRRSTARRARSTRVTRRLADTTRPRERARLRGRDRARGGPARPRRRGGEPSSEAGAQVGQLTAR